MKMSEDAEIDTERVSGFRPQAAGSLERSFHRRGIALVVVLLTAVVFSIAAFGVLTVAVSRARQIDYLGEDRIRYRAAAEAGLVWAMQRLWVTPGWCGAPPFPPLDTDGDGIPETVVSITVAPCGPNVQHTLDAKVTW